MRLKWEVLGVPLMVYGLMDVMLRGFGEVN